MDIEKWESLLEFMEIHYQICKFAANARMYRVWNGTTPYYVIWIDDRCAAIFKSAIKAAIYWNTSGGVK